jgi:rhodanese-related sulfurtransferase/signal-transduction protein with cAMP-binding, CBS, and nucleotidyltransferase domain
MVRALDVKVLAGLEPISTFGSARLRELLDYCQVENVPEGNDPFRTHGLEGQSVYLVEGEIELAYQDGNRVVVDASSEWAKHPLGKRQPAIVAARALRDSQLLRVDDELLDRMVTLDQIARHDTQADMHATAQADAGAASSVRHLLLSGMFNAEQLRNGPLAHVPMTNIGALLQRFETVVVWAGDVIIREGEDGDYYYLIDSGRAEVTRHVGGVDVLLAELKAGDVFGEEALISGAKRNATITMKSNGVLLRLGRQDFMALLQEPLLHRIGYEQAVRAVAGGAVWIDVRHPSEYRYDRLPGAMNLPLNDVRNAIGVLDRGKQYIAYCQSGRRSAAAAFILAQAGYDIQVLDGGLWSVPKSKQQ